MPGNLSREARPRLIAFAGRAGSGKSFAAEALVEHGFTRVKFADPLKNMMRAIGLTERQIEGDLKTVPCELLCGKTPRHAMQTVGTEWGRDQIGPELWLNLFQQRVKSLAGRDIVCDDVRFPNEAELIRAMGGTIVRIYSAKDRQDAHISEQHDLPCDMEVFNDFGPCFQSVIVSLAAS